MSLSIYSLEPWTFVVFTSLSKNYSPCNEGSYSSQDAKLWGCIGGWGHRFIRTGFICHHKVAIAFTVAKMVVRWLRTCIRGGGGGGGIPQCNYMK